MANKAMEEYFQDAGYFIGKRVTALMCQPLLDDAVDETHHSIEDCLKIERFEHPLLAGFKYFSP